MIFSAKYDCWYGENCKLCLIKPKYKERPKSFVSKNEIEAVDIVINDMINWCKTNLPNPRLRGNKIVLDHLINMMTGEEINVYGVIDEFYDIKNYRFTSENKLEYHLDMKNVFKPRFMF